VATMENLPVCAGDCPAHLDVPWKSWQECTTKRGVRVGDAVVVTEVVGAPVRNGGRGPKTPNPLGQAPVARQDRTTLAQRKLGLRPEREAAATPVVPAARPP
jgi:hypothetical protein